MAQRAAHSSFVAVDRFLSHAQSRPDPIGASSESSFCNINGHQPIVHDIVEQGHPALSVETDSIF